MKIKRSFLLLLVILSGLFFNVSCIHESEPDPVYIGISKALPAEYYGHYAKWVNTADSNIICLDLYHMPLDSALWLLDKCSGLIVSGGPDVYPGRYGQDGDTVKCGGIDYYRDTLEFALIGKAIDMEMPILGICRGLQIFNVFHGGSLYPDIPTDFDSSVMHRCEDPAACLHEIRVMKESGLYKTAGIGSGTVNSNHHQGIRRIADGIVPVARSFDGLIEAIEYENADEMPFFLGVQWHPERMDPQNPLSLPIAMYFVQEAKLYSLQKENK